MSDSSAPPAKRGSLTSKHSIDVNPNAGEPEPLWHGRIRVRGEVGRGAMGEVLRGFDMKLGREMAIKVMKHPKRQTDRQLLARFVEEAQITAQLEHPNVVPVHDFGVDPAGRAYFSMKLVRGRSLDDILEQRRQGDMTALAEFGLRRLLEIFLQVCQAIEYAHARGVIHRDLKPANVMIGDFGEVAVTDWGVAKLLDGATQRTDAVSTRAEVVSESDADIDAASAHAPLPEVTSVRAATKARETQSGTVLGTPQYMSPEQARGEPVDERTDVYALGVILYEILCGTVPFDDDEPNRVLLRVIDEEPLPPSRIDPSVPPSLEALVLRMLVKDPSERTLPLRKIRAHIQDHIEGVGREYRRERFWQSLTWSTGALVLFAFLVWYLTGKSAAKVLVMGPSVALNAVGWFLFALAVRYPLWALTSAVRLGRRELDPFRKPEDEELFVSGYLAHRSFSAAFAPVFQLVFIVELVTLAVLEVGRGELRSGQLMEQIAMQMGSEWSEALIVILVFQFAYLFLLSTEVRFARRIDRYDLLVERPRWESVWPFFLIVVLLLTVTTTDLLRITAAAGVGAFSTRLAQELFVRESPFEIVKMLVFQGTFLLGLAATTLVAAFSFRNLLAALRAVHDRADEAAVAARPQHFLRALAVFRVTRGVWLYGGAMIGVLTAIGMLADPTERALLEKVIFLIGPWLIGFSGYALLRGSMRRYMEQAPTVARLLEERRATAKDEQRRATLAELERVPWRWPLAQLAVPVCCIAVYLAWTGSGFRREAIEELILPVTTKDWLVILPYALLLVVLVVRDPVQRWLLRRSLRSPT